MPTESQNQSIYPESPVDSDTNVSTSANDALMTAARNMSSAYRQKAASDANVTSPAEQRDAQGNFTSPTGPKVAKPLFGSPLKLGDGGLPPFGPSGERCVTSDFNEARNVTNETGVIVGGRKHLGIDLRCPVGEPVLAMADGVVVFVGYSRKNGANTSSAVQVGHPKVDATTGNIVDVDTKKVVAHIGPPNEIAYAGIYVAIAHEGDFSGYKTMYMHLSDTAVRLKDEYGKQVRVKKGQVIGFTGQTGGDTGKTRGPHLHLQVMKNGKPENPCILFPNYKPNARLVRVDGRIEGKDALGAIAQQNAAGLQSRGASVVTNNLANQVQCQDREIACANQTPSEMKERQSEHASIVASNIDVHTTAVYKAVSEFQSALPQIENPVYFDFDTGLWSDQPTPPVSGAGL